MKSLRLAVPVMAGLVLMVACNEAPAGAQDDIDLAAGEAGVDPANPLAPDWLKLTGRTGPLPGRYACQDWVGYSSAKVQADALYGGNVRQSSYFTSQFSFTGPSDYIYHGTKPIDGTYAYDPQTGAIVWESGSYSSDPGTESSIEGIYGIRESDSVPTVIQIFRDPTYGEAAELCFRYREE